MIVRPIGLLLIALALTGQSATPPPAIRFTTPVNGDYVSDRIPLMVRIDPPDQVNQIASITFYADGKQVCVVTDVTRPRCDWDAGPEVKEHALRAVATLTNGERRTAAIRTRALTVAESVSVRVVQITATVTDNDGRFVKGLTKEQFRVFENAEPQTVQFFGAEETPLDVIVALDVSASMTNVLPDLKVGVAEFLAALRPADQVTLLAFNDSVYTLAPRDLDPAKRSEILQDLRAWGNTALYDGIRDALKRLARGRGRRAIVLFTDGEDSASSSTLQQAIAAIGDSDVTLFVIQLGRGPKKTEFRKRLESLALPSGGRVLTIDDPDKLAAQFAEVVRELANQYLVGYEPRLGGVPGEWRRIKIELVNLKHRVRARQGYRIPAP